MVVFDPELAARMKMPKELLDKASELHLAMHIGQQHVYAALYDFSSSLCLWNVHSEVPTGISVFKFIYQRNWIEAVFRRCSVTFDSDCYALIPASLFDPLACNEYIEMQHGVTTDQTGFIELPEADAVVCFELPVWQFELLKCFPNARVLPLSALLTRVVAPKGQSSSADFLVAYSSASVTITAVKNKALLLLVTHEARTEEDVLYHLSNAAMRLQIDLDNCSLQLLDMSGRDELLALLQRYTKHAVALSAVNTNGGCLATQLHYLCA